MSQYKDYYVTVEAKVKAVVKVSARDEEEAEELVGDETIEWDLDTVKDFDVEKVELC